MALFRGKIPCKTGENVPKPQNLTLGPLKAQNKERHEVFIYSLPEAFLEEKRCFFRDSIHFNVGVNAGELEKAMNSQIQIPRPHTASQVEHYGIERVQLTEQQLIYLA